MLWRVMSFSRLLMCGLLAVALAAPVQLAAAQIASCGPGQSGTKSSFAGGAGAACVAACPAGQIQTPRGSGGECCLKAGSSGTDPCVGVGGGNILDSVACPGHGVSSFFANRVFACQCVGPANIRTDNTLGSACIPRADCPAGSVVEFSGGRDAYCNRAPASPDTPDTPDTPDGGGGGGGLSPAAGGGGLFSTISGWSAGIVAAFQSALGWVLDLFVDNVWPLIYQGISFVGEYILVGILTGLDSLWKSVGYFVVENWEWLLALVVGFLVIYFAWGAIERVGLKLIDLGMGAAYRLLYFVGGGAVASGILYYVLTVFFTEIERLALGSGVSAAAFSSVYNIGYSSGPLQSLFSGVYQSAASMTADRAAIVSASHAGFVRYFLHLLWIGPGLKVLFVAYFLRFLIRRFTLTVQLAGG